MKKLMNLILFLFPLMAFGQESVTTLYLFEQFQPGRAYLVRGGYSDNSLNYNLAAERFLFMQDGEPLVLANAEDFSSIVIGDRVFVPARGGAFRERVLLPGGKAYYIRWWAELNSKGKPAGYGGYTQTSPVETYGSLYADGQQRALASGELFEVKSRNVYTVTVNGREKSFTNLKALTKIFKSHKNEMTDFAARESIDFSKPGDVQRIMEFCAPFM